MIQRSSHTGHAAMLSIALAAMLHAHVASGQFCQVINTYPYNEGFETGPAWVTGGLASDWAWGQPLKPTINSAGGGQFCWMVGGVFASFYNFGQQSFLMGPCFDMTTLDRPWISFKLFWETETEYDGLVLQYSLDQGITWANVGAFGDTEDCLNMNWYNTADVPGLTTANPRHGWTGRIGPDDGNCLGGSGSGGWITASKCLPQLAGEESVRFRFLFGSGTMCNNYDGVAIDDVFVGNAPDNEQEFTFTCNGNTVEFDEISNLCALTYQWDFGDPGSGQENTSTDPSPSHTYPGPGTYQVTLSTTGPCNTTGLVTVPVTILEVEFQVQPPDCEGEGGSVTAIPTAGFAPYTYSWEPGGENTATIDGLGLGTYTVTVTGEGACPSSATVVLDEVTGGPDVQFVIDDVSCNGAGDGTVLAQVIGGVEPYSYDWGALNNTTSQVTGLGPGSYTLTLTDAAGCTTVATAEVNEPEVLEVATDAELEVCSGTAVSLLATGQGGTAPYTFAWSQGPQFTPQENVTVTVSITDANGCTAPDGQTNVVVLPAPQPELAMDVFEGCAPLCVTFTELSGSTGTITWDLGDGTVVEATSPYTHCYGLGEWNASVSIIDPSGCTGSAEAPMQVGVFPSPVAGFEALPAFTTIDEPLVRFIDLSFGGAQWSWDFGYGGAIPSEEQFPEHRFTEVGCHEVMQVVRNSASCSDTAYAVVCVDEAYALFAPTAFTPDEDGINDGFRVVTTVTRPEFFELLIFDRWGSVVHSSTDPLDVWDGTLGASQAPIGVYPWKVRLKDTLGQERQHQGHVTLVR